MTTAATPRAHFGIARSWREAWKIAEHNPLLLLIALALLAGTVEVCVQSANAVSEIPVPDKIGYAASWLAYFGFLIVNQVLIAIVTAGIALVMVVKAEPDESYAQSLRRPLLMRYFRRVIIGWLCILGVTSVVGIPVNFATQIYASAIQGRWLEPSFYMASTIIFAILQAGFASLLFLRLPETLSGARRELLRGERGRFFMLYASRTRRTRSHGHIGLRLSI